MDISRQSLILDNTFQENRLFLVGLKATVMTTKEVTIDIGYKPEGNATTTGMESSVYTYNADGHTINVMDSVDPDGLRGYRKCVHTTQDGAKIGAIKTKWMVTSGFQEDLGRHSVVTVYFWRRDSDYERPLLVQLGDSYYKNKKHNNAEWKALVHAPQNLEHFLDGQNCKRNSAHVVDLSEKGSNSGRGQYQCPGCSKASILLNRDENLRDGYHKTLWVHSPMGKLGNIRNGELTIHSPPENVHNVYVIWYGTSAVPLLFYYRMGDVNRWFSRHYGDEEWVALDNSILVDREEAGEIEALLEKLAIPRVILDVSRSNGRYTPKGTSIEFFVVKEEGSVFCRFKQSMGGTFFIKGIQHGDVLLCDITSSEALSSVSALYEGDVMDVRKLLLVELVRENPKRYMYYGRHNGTMQWVQVSHVANLSGSLLQLDELEGLVYPSATGEAPNAKSSRKMRAIAGGLAGGMAGVVLFFVMWRYSSVMNSCLTGRFSRV